MIKRMLFNIILFPLKTVNFLRRRFEKKIEIKDKFIISVGNISFGGSGKTPLVIALSKMLEGEGLNSAIFLRGYKSKMENIGGAVELEKGLAKVWGDEAILIKRNVNSSVFVGKDRIKQMKNLRNKDIKIFILDDGFQYFKLKKDLEILIHNFKNPSILTRDFLSELKKANIILNNSDMIIKDIEKYQIVFSGIFDYKDNLTNNFKDKIFIGFCGIGNPQSFKKTLKDNKIKIKELKIFPDHYNYTEKDIKKLLSYNLPLITTEKDFVKLKEYNIKNLHYLKIDVKFGYEFKQRILEEIEKKTAS